MTTLKPTRADWRRPSSWLPALLDRLPVVGPARLERRAEALRRYVQNLVMPSRSILDAFTGRTVVNDDGTEDWVSFVRPAGTFAEKAPDETPDNVYFIEGFGSPTS